MREMAPAPMQLGRPLAIMQSACAHDSIAARIPAHPHQAQVGHTRQLFVIFGATLIATLRSTPIYDAVGSIAINKPDPMLANLREANGSEDYYDPTDLDTEVRILRSDLLALQVIKQLNLDKLPEFGGHGCRHPPPWDSPPMRFSRTPPGQ